MAYKNIPNWPMASASKPRAGNKNPTGEIDIPKNVLRHVCRSRQQNLACGSLKLITLVAALLTLSACAGLSVQGTVGGQTIKTRVDSEVARYYVGSYLAEEHTNPALDKRIDRVYQSTNGNLPARSELKHLSDEFSVDFAALYFADQIARVPANRRFRSAFEQAYDYARKAFPEGRVRLPHAWQAC
jgi:hypothetical protein